MSEPRKQSLHLPLEMFRELQAEALRQDRSLSWIVQQAWRCSRVRVGRMPAPGALAAPSEAR